MQLEKIFVSIAAYRDLELYPTVENLLRQAKYPERIYLSLVVQDRVFPDFTELFAKYQIAGHTYVKIDYTNAKGVGFARAKTQEPLNKKYKYYLQVDSHSRFTENWDTKIISDYKRLSELWGRIILSTYPPAYTINSDGTETLDDDYVPVIKIIETDDVYKFEAKYFDTAIDTSNGFLTNYFTGGQSFGLTEDILTAKYDPDIYFWGEEQTLSLRFFEQGISIIAPPRNYVFHDYDGSRRVRHWDSNTIQEMYKSRSNQRIRRFFKCQLDEYGIKDPTLLSRYLDSAEFIRNFEGT
jgi:hypothetical protein